jgi:hypothetical protein
MTEGGRSIVWRAVIDVLRRAQERGILEIRPPASTLWVPGMPDGKTADDVCADLAAEISRGIEAQLERLALQEAVKERPAPFRPRLAVLQGGRSVLEGPPTREEWESRLKR